jgi:hypothetical protein
LDLQAVFLSDRPSAKLSADGKLASSLSLPPLDPSFERTTICGSIGLNQDIAAQLLAKNFNEGNLSNSRNYVFERAFIGDGICSPPLCRQSPLTGCGAIICIGVFDLEGVKGNNANLTKTGSSTAAFLF